MPCGAKRSPSAATARRCACHVRRRSGGVAAHPARAGRQTAVPTTWAPDEAVTIGDLACRVGQRRRGEQALHPRPDHRPAHPATSTWPSIARAASWGWTCGRPSTRPSAHRPLRRKPELGRRPPLFRLCLWPSKSHNPVRPLKWHRALRNRKRTTSRRVNIPPRFFPDHAAAPENRASSPNSLSAPGASCPAP